MLYIALALSLMLLIEAIIFIPDKLPILRKKVKKDGERQGYNDTGPD